MGWVDASGWERSRAELRARCRPPCWRALCHQPTLFHLPALPSTQDMRDWARLNDGERHFISYVLAFFAASDGIVLENLSTRFMNGA